MSWYKVTLSNEDIAAFKHMALQERFIELFVANGGPRDAGMFDSPEIGVHEYYFSPGATRIALALIASYGGVECSSPAKSETHPLVIEGDAEQIPFRPNPST